MGNRVITIGREYGSKGRMIAKALSEKLGIHYYHKELIQMVSEQSDIPYEMLKEADEKKQASWRVPVADDIQLERRLRYEPMDDLLFEKQSQIIRDLAEKEDCIILGRCSNYILRDRDNCKSVFIHAPLEKKIENVMEVMGLERKNAQTLIKKMDKQRKYYYNYYTDQSWADMSQYSMCLDSSQYTMEQILQILTGLYESI